jgi:cbb3-type cytochrome oxidase subunit 3
MRVSGLIILVGLFFVCTTAHGLRSEDKHGFRQAKVIVLIENPDHAGIQVYSELIRRQGFDGFEAWIHHCSKLVATSLYETTEAANARNLDTITYKLKDGGALSYKAGAPPHIEIGFDLNYLIAFAEKHGTEAASDEVSGILCHELTHAFQAEPKNAGGYEKDTEFFGFIEGLADLVRLQTGGFNPARYPVAGGNFTQGYTTTAFFYLWIVKKLDPEFIRTINRTALEWDSWSHERLFMHLFQKSATELWQQYQLEIDNYPWHEVR